MRDPTRVNVFATYAQCPHERHSAVILYLNLGTLTPMQQAMRNLCVHIMQSHVFDELRSNQQLGYQVETEHWGKGLYIGVVSMYKPAFVVQKMWTCLDKIAQEILNMSTGSLEMYKRSTGMDILPTADTLMDFREEEWNKIDSSTYVKRENQVPYQH